MPSRRSLLAGAVTAAATTSGCIEWVDGRDPPVEERPLPELPDDITRTSAEQFAEEYATASLQNEFYETDYDRVEFGCRTTESIEMESGYIVTTHCGYATYRERSVGDGSRTGGTFLIREGGFQRLPHRTRVTVTSHESRQHPGELRGFDVVNFSVNESHLEISIHRLEDNIRERILERAVPISPERHYHVPVVTEVAGTYETRLTFGDRDTIDLEWVNPAIERDTQVASSPAFGVFLLPDGSTYGHVYDT